jgi:hypothetical protein
MLLVFQSLSLLTQYVLVLQYYGAIFIMKDFLIKWNIGCYLVGYYGFDSE